MPRSRFDELVALAEDNDGLVPAEQARQAGFTDSVMTRLVQRGRIERTSRGVYRIPYFPPNRFSQYREAVLWAKANRGPDCVAVSHASALAVYGISDANPHQIHLAIPKSARLRRQKPKGVVLHRERITSKDITVHEGVPLTTISRTVMDLLESHARTDLVQQAIADARREGLILEREAKQLRRQVQQHGQD
jgi:predicted transcriptional regulator of viral defense system